MVSLKISDEISHCSYHMSHQIKCISVHKVDRHVIHCIIMKNKLEKTGKFFI